MIIARYDKTRQYDELLDKVIGTIKEKTTKGNDDFLLLCCGATGTGKSMLMLHVMQAYMNQSASVDYIGLDQADFATALKLSKNKEGLRFCCNDEANISKRDALNRYNKSLIDLYFAIRGLNIFHWWNNPSVDIIEKIFLEERIKGVIFITTKETNKPRLYFYFTKKGLLQIWEKYGNLKTQTLKRVRKKYAYYRGWFRDYKGDLLTAYSLKKKARMSYKIDNFYQEYGLGLLQDKQIAHLLGCTSSTVKNYTQELISRNLIKAGEIETASNGKHMYNLSVLNKFRELQKEKLERRSANRLKAIEKREIDVQI